MLIIIKYQLYVILLGEETTVVLWTNKLFVVVCELVGYKIGKKSKSRLILLVLLFKSEALKQFQPWNVKHWT